MKIETCNDLKRFLEGYLRRFNRPASLSYEDVIWFVAMYQTAVMLETCSASEIARLMIAGSPPINSEYVATWLTSLEATARRAPQHMRVTVTSLLSERAAKFYGITLSDVCDLTRGLLR